MIHVGHYIILAVILFIIGAIVCLARRNPLAIFMGIELMLNSANLVLMAFAKYMNNVRGEVMIIFVLALAAAEAAIGLAIIIFIYRDKDYSDINEMDMLKW